MIAVMLVIFLIISISVVLLATIACRLFAIVFGVAAELSTSLLSATSLVSVFTTNFDSG